jgi:hypothetical protein
MVLMYLHTSFLISKHSSHSTLFNSFTRKKKVCLQYREQSIRSQDSDTTKQDQYPLYLSCIFIDVVLPETRMAVMSLKTLHLYIKKSHFSQRDLYVCVSMWFRLPNVTYFFRILAGSHFDISVCVDCRSCICRHYFQALISLAICDTSPRISLFRTGRASNVHWISLFLLRCAVVAEVTLSTYWLCYCLATDESWSDFRQRERFVFSSPNLQTCSGAHLASYSVNTRVLVLRCDWPGQIKLLT